MPDRRRFLQRSGLAAGALVLPELRWPPFGARSLDNQPPLAIALPDGPDLPLVPNVDPRRLIPQVRRVLAATKSLGTPLNAEDEQALEAAFSPAGITQAVTAAEAIQRVLDRSCLLDVHINPEVRVKVARGLARPTLVEHGWRPFLVKVWNEAGTTAALRATSAQARPRAGAPAGELAHLWLDLLMFDDPPLLRTLSGLELEYRIVRLYSHDAGPREASLAFDVGQGTQDLGFRNHVPILFDCRPAQ
jgi:hypothetical protein